jgi:hypothetical protein
MRRCARGSKLFLIGILIVCLKEVETRLALTAAF